MSDATADFLLELRLERRTVDELPASLVPPSLADGYRTQAHLTALLCATRGGAPIDYKVALTSQVAQSLVGHPAPVYGRLLSHSSYRGPATLDAAEFTTRVVEVEFGFRMATDVPAGEQTSASIARHVAAVLPSIEIVDHRFAGLDRMSASGLAADNAIHGAWIEGEPVPTFADLDLAHHAVNLSVNREQILTGAGDRVLGHPLNVLAWLANELPVHGLALRAGDLVTTGLATDGIYDASAGDSLLSGLWCPRPGFPGLYLTAITGGHQITRRPWSARCVSPRPPTAAGSCDALAARATSAAETSAEGYPHLGTVGNTAEQEHVVRGYFGRSPPTRGAQWFAGSLRWQ